MYHSIYSGLINKKWKNDGRYGIIIRYAYIHRKGSGVEDRVSVILLIYMVEAYLPKCIESAINQTYKDIEIILSVGEGPDRCVEICREYAAKDDRIKVVQRERKGRGPGRNFGMEAATGKYVLFIDGDDCMGETMVEKLVLAAKKHGADAVICGDQYEYENEPGRVEKHIAGLPEVFGRKELYAEILSRKSFGLEVWNKMFLLEKIRDIAYLDETAEDRFWSVKAYRRLDTIAYVPSCEFHYAVRGNSGSRKPHVMEASMRADKLLCNDIRGNGYLKEECDYFMFTSCYNALYEALHFGYFEYGAWRETYEEFRRCASTVRKSGTVRRQDRIKANIGRAGFRPLIWFMKLSMRLKPAGLYDAAEEV